MKSVTICGSGRYFDEINQFAARLKQLGVSMIFTPHFETRRKNFYTLEERERMESRIYRAQLPMAVLQPLDRIRKAEVCFVYNKNGYLGINTTLEIGFAHGREIPIYALEAESDYTNGGEICRSVLFTDVVATPEELFELLK